MKSDKKIKGYYFGPAIFADDNSSVDLTGVFSDEDVIQSIIGGRRGLSPEIKIKWYQCNLCLQDYEMCLHEDGQIYENKKCELIPRDMEMVRNSLVDIPKDPRARITDFLVIEKLHGKSYYTWYGFKTDKENRRFKHIQKANDSGFISEKIALKFSNYFMESFQGVIKYSP